MTKAFVRSLLCLSVLLPAVVQAGNVVKIGFPADIPPWVNTDGHTGIAIELLREALAAEKLQLQPVISPYARRLQAYRHGQLDGLYNISSRQLQNEQLNGSLSQPLHSFDNIALALPGRKLELNSVRELGQWRIMAWDGAASDLPAGYDPLLALADGKYQETANQQRQLMSLLGGNVDIILSERLAFERQHQQLRKQQSRRSEAPLRIFAVLPPKEVSVLFRDSGLRARLDLRIRSLQNSPRYQAIFARYDSPVQP